MSFKTTSAICLAAVLTTSSPALAQSASDETPTPGQVLGGLIVLGILGAMMADGGSDDSGSCDLPSYTANWSQAAKDHACWQGEQTARYEEEQERLRQENDALALQMLLMGN